MNSFTISTHSQVFYCNVTRGVCWCGRFIGDDRIARDNEFQILLGKTKKNSEMMYQIFSYLHSQEGLLKRPKRLTTGTLHKMLSM